MVARCAASALAAAILMVSAAKAAEFDCPNSIAVKEDLTGTPPQGWALRADPNAHGLLGITFFDGNPGDQASLAPDKDVPASGRDRTATWHFGAGSTPVWISCRYIGTSVTLERPLPAKYRMCEIRYGAGAVIRRVYCA